MKLPLQNHATHTRCVFLFLLCGPQQFNISQPLGTLNDPYIFRQTNGKGEGKCMLEQLYLCSLHVRVCIWAFKTK